MNTHTEREVIALLSTCGERELLNARDHIDDILDGLRQAQRHKQGQMYNPQTFEDYMDEKQEGEPAFLTKKNIHQGRCFLTTTRQRALIQAMFGGKICGDISILALTRLADGTPHTCTCRNNIPREWMQKGSQLTQFTIPDLTLFFQLCHELEETGSCTTTKGKKVRVGKDRPEDPDAPASKPTKKPKVDVEAVASEYLNKYIT